MSKWTPEQRQAIDSRGQNLLYRLQQDQAKQRYWFSGLLT